MSSEPTPVPSAPASWKPSFRTVLVGLVLIGLVPMSVFAGALVLTVWQLQQHEARRGLFATAEALLMAVESEVTANVRQLEILAGSPLLDADDPTPFRQRARHLVGNGSPWTNVFLIAPDGREVMSLDRAPGEERATPLDPALVDAVVESHRPAVSQRLTGLVPGQHDVVLVAVPVLWAERLIGVLAAALDLGHFDRIVSERVVRGGGIGGVLDQDLRIIARSRSPDRYRGAEVIEPIRNLIPGGPRGWARTPVYDGPDVYAVWATGPATGWTVTLGVPAEPIDAALRRSLGMTAGAGLLIVLGVAILATIQARRHTRSIRDVAEATGALARLDPLPPIRRTLREHDTVAGALRAAADVLHRQARENQRLLAAETAARREAEEANRAKDEFLAMLAHELRNPLAAIGSAGAVLEAVPEGAPAAAKARDIVVRQTAHLARLVDDLLDAARLNTGKIRIVRTKVDLAALLARCIHTVWPDPPTHDVNLDAEPLWVEGDVTRLEQVFGNLLANARKFTPPGGRIDVALHREGDAAVVAVRDTGEGMSEELVPRVFDLFVQGQRRLDRAGGGLGIGLSLVRHLVELHGGTIVAESGGLGEGSTFRVRLPSCPPPRTEAAEERRPESPGPRASVLLVEDGADIREALATLLRHRGHTVHSAADGPAALDLFARFRPEIVLLDIGLPEMDGFEVAERMRATASHPFRLVALTGYGAEADRRRTAAVGFSAHLVKPVEPERLFRVLETPS